MDGKGKAPPSAGRKGLVGLRFFGVSRSLPAGARRQMAHEFNARSAIAPAANRFLRHD